MTENQLVATTNLVVRQLNATPYVLREACVNSRCGYHKPISSGRWAGSATSVLITYKKQRSTLVVRKRQLLAAQQWSSFAAARCFPWRLVTSTSTSALYKILG